MADKNQGDLLMKFVQLSGEPVKGEAASTLGSGDKLLSDFAPGKFIEIEQFQFGLDLDDDQAIQGAPGPQAAPRAGAGQTAKFSAWRDYKKKNRSDVADIAYPVVLAPFSFSRFMDRASPIFFQNCCNSISFDSAALVKRKVTGADLSLQGFLRIDFKNVLIIGLDWDDGHVVTEKCKFICRGLTVQYKQQNEDGTLGAARSAAWTRDLTTRAA